jgi:hypothetical protein
LSWADGEDRAIPFRTDSPSVVSIIAVSEAKWKTFDGKPIPFPAGEDQAHVRLVRNTLPEGFFSKKASTKLPAPDPKRAVILKLRKPLEGTYLRSRRPRDSFKSTAELTTHRL